MEPHINVRALGRIHQTPDRTELEVLKDVCFDVDRGGFVSIVGPSGSGKSTLLHLIAGIDVPTSGEIRIDGRIAGGNPGSRIGFVFQEPRLLDWRTVWGNVALPLESMPVGEAERKTRIERHLALVGLSGFEDYYPGQLSGGMRQRVALARALAIEPEMLLMDEPFGSLDAITAERLRLELVRIWRETGKTILFVTHDIPEAVFLSQRVLFLKGKPAKIVEAVAVDLPYPRELDDQRLFERSRQVRHLLQERST